MTAEPDLLPSSIAAFTEALHGDRGSLDAWLEVNDEREVRAHVEAYARANIGVATAARDAEIEALRAEVERLRADRDSWEQQASDRVADWHAEYLRAERLAEALRLIESAKDRGFGIDYARGVAQSALRDHDQEAAMREEGKQ